MRTDLIGQHLQQEKAEKCPTVNNEDRGVNGVRRSLHPLQEAAGDKENLVGGGRLKQMAVTKEKPSTSLPDPKPVKRAKSSKSDKVASILEDLTSEVEPSKEYWELLAEQRRIALEQALKENEQLHERIAILEEENLKCKAVIEDTQAVITTLTEMLNEEKDENEASDENEDSKDK
ncbi:geminin [Cimex lectularius]|uniref:Geminin n=1 Tax=Cimex lectularius TaxID=79782 RepID=A0A8I6RMY7_CIMLE|nr:geminin [Cimex lectularius]